MRLLLPAIYCFAIVHTVNATDTLRVSSPDGKINVSLALSPAITYRIEYRNEPVIIKSFIGLTLLNGPSFENLAVKSVAHRSVDSIIIAPFPEKRKHIPDQYNEATVRFRQPLQLIIRAYNDGIAYRFVTTIADSITVKSERAEFNFAGNYPLYFPAVAPRTDADIFHTSFEEPYQFKVLDSLSAQTLCFTPVLAAPQNGFRILITESDLEDYPGMFVSGNNDHSLHGVFAPYPLEEKIVEGDYPERVVTRRANFIARTTGSRKFPWRVIAIAAEDKALPANDIVYRLASPSRVKDISWIHPGKGTDEWIIGINLFNVPFTSGINTATYKYYIDFAKRFGFDRIMLDAGWSDTRDLLRITPGLDMDTIAAYAKQNNIRLSMWTLAMTLDRQLEPALDQFNRWGVDFIMTDFIDRDDQQAVRFYYRVAEACVRHRLMLMYHGAFKPAGFGRTFPNALTRESVLGSEYNAWSNKATPEHNVQLPFIRMVSGPMDYEPGLLDNGTRETFRPIWNKVMSFGTRCHQLAMFVVYESPMQFFSGNPSQGLMEPRFMELLGSIPTTWDTTIVVDGKIGEYIITARKKGNDWFIAGMTNWTARSLPLQLNFLDEGIYDGEWCEDGINADRHASDYRMSSSPFRRGDTFNIGMAHGGGWLLRLRKR